MPWISSYYTTTATIPTNGNSWIFSGGNLSVFQNAPPSTLTYGSDYPSLSFYSTTQSISFSSRKNYQYITQVQNFYSAGTSFSVATPWSDSFLYDNYSISGNYATATPQSPGNGYLYFYSSPTVDIISATYVTYEANKKFGTNTSPTEGLINFKINEIDFNIQGYSFFRSTNTLGGINLSADSLGWTYYSNTKSYSWFDSRTYTGSLKYPCGPLGYNVPSSDFRGNNNLSKLIPYPFFNLSFIYQRILGGANDGISIYLSPTLPSVSGSSFSLPSGGVLVASLTQSGTSSVDAQFYGLNGNQYLLIVASTGLTSSATYSSIVLSDVKVEGGYHPGNNRQYESYYDSIDLYPQGIIGTPSYITYVGTGNTVNATQSLNISQLFSKIGNGSFKAGIWENGVWNSGWRYDDGVYEFYEVGTYYDYGGGKNWRFVISGPPSSLSQFKVGDKISIGNIVAIDINEDRKLIKNYFTIISVNYSNTTTLASSNFIIVEFISNFPLRRIEKDSSNHRIFITKNVWLSGAFLNGYFKGIWNYGLFKGYPLITEMFESHWIDGVFDGGHFGSTQLGLTFSDTVYKSITLDLRPASKVGLVFSTPHRLNVGDVITIDKDDKTVNTSYDGETTVIEVSNEYQITTDKKFERSRVSESGSIYTNISNGLVQNFDFRSHNISTVTSVNSLDSDTVFIYNSWMDVIYNSYSAVNIGKQQTLLDRVSRRSYSQNNLYGYPTNDVLSSKSKFRDSYSTTERDYKLGTKYKIFNDYIGDSSKFEDYFGPTGPDGQLFIDQGWTYSSAPFINSANPTPITGSITFSRTSDSGIDPITGKELKVESVGNGGVLDISTPKSYVTNRTTTPIEKQRYTVVQFDLLTYSVSSDYFELNQQNKSNGGKSKGNDWSQPVIHFNNINIVNRDVYYSLPGTYSATFSTVLPATYLPIYQNIDHLSTKKYIANGSMDVPSTRKFEYFYGKRNLSMYFKGSGLYGSFPSNFIIDNLNLFEIDMVPFFQYFTEDNINKSVQIPFQGIAPFIDYTNSNFSFLDNISIGFDSVSVVSSSLPVSGVGVSIGGGFVGGFGSISMGSSGGDLYEGP